MSRLVQMPDIVKGSGQTHRDTKRSLVDQFGGKCQQCGYHRCMRALQFHHADGSEKQDWSGKTGRASTKEIKAHPERFILLCSNCHFEEHERIARENILYSTCLRCGDMFITRPSREKDDKRGWYCSRECYGKDRYRIAMAGISDRLWKRVEKIGECYVWTGCAPRGTPVMGYTVSHRNGVTKPVARVLWELERGALDENQTLRRACETLNCIRPEHQIIGPRRARREKRK